MARDITEGRAGRAIAVDVGIVSTNAIWQNTNIAYDVAVGGMPFIYAISDARPYVRQTAPFRKDQFDNGSEPGEQSLVGWWIRSQSSFHKGAGIKFYDTTAGELTSYRYFESRGVNPWTKGQVTLLKSCTPGHITTGSPYSNNRQAQSLRSIEWNGTKGVLMHDEYDVDKIDANGTETHFINYNAGVDFPVYGICDDGTTAYWVTNNATGGKMEVYKKVLTADYTTAGTSMMSSPSIVVTNAIMEYVKERIILCANNSIYEFAPSASALPTPIFTHSSSSYVYTSIAASGTAIYVSGYNGIQSSILKFTLSSTGTMPTLTSAITAAEMPAGEKIYKIAYYLDRMLIGTSKGIRAATIDANGSIAYGPLIVETAQPCYDFAMRDKFVWCAVGVEAEGISEPGVIRLDMSEEIEPLRFAYANDLEYEGVYGHNTTACAFIDGTDRLAFTSDATVKGTLVVNKAKSSNTVTLTTSTAHGLSVGDTVWVEGVAAVSGSTFNSTTAEFTILSVPSTTTFTYTLAGSDVASTAVSSTSAKVKTTGRIYIESANELVTSGYITTGAIRYGTLEPKNFKRLLGRGDFTYGSMALETVDAAGTEYDHITYNSLVSEVEVTTSSPATAQEYVSYKFLLTRDTTDSSLGPIFKGYQAKATIATSRQRIMKFPVYCYDTETDRYNAVVGYEGRALERIQELEEIEASGDVITWQDLTTKESRQAVIEQITFTRLTPPDKRFDGMGGVLEITIRTV